MADFTSGFWSWYIGGVTLIGIICLLVFALKMSARGKRKPGDKAEPVGHVWDEDLEELNNPLPRWWLNLFLITLVWGLVYLFLYPGLGAYAGYLGWTQKQQYDTEIEKANAEYGPIYERFLHTDIATLSADPDALAIGGRLFANYCTQCHGSDARGARGFPNLTDDDWLHGGTPADIETTILDGRQGSMPPWEGVIDHDGIFNVAEYVRTLGGRSADPQVAARGKLVFDQYCVVCHGADGKGNVLLGAPDLTDDTWLYGGTQKTIMQTVAKGRNGSMPPHRAFLGEARVHLLAAYVYSLSREH
jgi:cytochrome c oxidase cbb3-type subunit III